MLFFLCVRVEVAETHMDTVNCYLGQIAANSYEYYHSAVSLLENRLDSKAHLYEVFFNSLMT